MITQKLVWSAWVAGCVGLANAADVPMPQKPGDPPNIPMGVQAKEAMEKNKTSSPPPAATPSVPTREKRDQPDPSRK